MRALPLALLALVCPGLVLTGAAQTGSGPPKTLPGEGSGLRLGSGPRGAEPDLEYGAYQRGYYVTAFREAMAGI